MLAPSTRSWTETRVMSIKTHDVGYEHLSGCKEIENETYVV